MNLIEATDEAIGCLVSFVSERVLSLHLNRSNYLMSICSGLARDEIEASVTVGKVDVPARVGHKSGHIELGKIVGVLDALNAVRLVDQGSL